MAVGVRNVSAMAFSQDGKYFAQLTVEGKLKLWDTETSVLKQEYIPNLHLKSPCTCLHWILAERKTTQSPWKKRKRKSLEGAVDLDASCYIIALGTSQGGVLLYSVADGNLQQSLGQDKKEASIVCLSWQKGDALYSCADDSSIVEWSLTEQCTKSKWKSGKDKPYSICVLPDLQYLVSASCTIKLWCLATKTLLRTFTGHSSPVVQLKAVLVQKDNDTSYYYVISGAENDRLLSVWNLSEKSDDKTAAVNFIMEDAASSFSASFEKTDGQVNITAVTRTGAVHHYKNVINGKCDKPIKPKYTTQVVSEDDDKNKKPQPIPIVGAHWFSSQNIRIGYGSDISLKFEKINTNELVGKINVLIRQVNQPVKQSNADTVLKTKIPVTDQNVKYLGPANVSNHSLKRASGKKGVELPLEQRLENLSLPTETLKPNSVPKSDNVAQLLIQGLHSKDKVILQNVFMKQDESLISNTVSRLPLQYLVPLLTELTTFIRGKTLSAQVGTVWLKILLQRHASHLMSVGTQNLVEIISPCLGIIENRLSLLQPISRLQGRLDLLVNQISMNKEENIDFSNQKLLVYQDPDSSDDDSYNEMAAAQSSSDDNWEEQSGEEEEHEEEMASPEHDTSEMSE